MPLHHSNARQQLDKIKKMLFSNCRPLRSPLPPYVLYVTEGAEYGRSSVRCFTGECVEALWESVICQLAKRVVQKLSVINTSEPTKDYSCGIKFEVVTECHSMPLERLKKAIASTKRNYFRFGVALDDAFCVSFTESEVQSHAMFYAGPQEENGGWNEKNIIHYMNDKYKNKKVTLPHDCDRVHTFVTSGVFLSADNHIYNLHSKGLRAGRRVLTEDTEPPGYVDAIFQATQTASDYLCDQLNENGYMRYGYFPVFDRLIPGRNSLRQVCATLALLESYLHYKKPRYLKSVKHSLSYLTSSLIKSIVINGKLTSYLTDSRNEIKLGGCGLLLLTLAKLRLETGCTSYDELMERLADGIRLGFPVNQSGLPVHVLNMNSMSVKEEFRTVYYEGEAMYGLAYYYRASKCRLTLKYLTGCFSSIIKQKRWKSRDHWLAYACDTMYEITEDERYVLLAANNIKGYLSFVQHRETAFPTLLELCTATERVARRYGSEKFYQLAECTPDSFKYATSVRANRLLDAYCWPEVAMDFKAPEKVLGSFFIRHHAFRVRVDDVGHFILGLLAYKKIVGKNREQIAC